MSELLTLKLNAIAESEHNPRKHFNPEKMAELVASIKAQGLLQPILVRPLPGHRVATTSRGTTHEIIAGARRFRASQLAGLATILAVVCQLDDGAAMEAALIENLQRDDLSELEEAEGYQQLCDLTGITKEAIGAKIGRSRRYVYDRLRLLKLQPLARTALRDGKVSATAALAIAAVHDGDLQAKALAQATSTNYAGDHPSTRELQKWMRFNVMLELAKAPFDIKATTLHPSAGACTTCPKRTGADPDIFAETQGPDSCCDAPCYHVKAAASRQAALEKFKAQGIKIIDGDDAEELSMSRHQCDFYGYTPVSQTREDTADGKPASLLDLLGKNGQAGVGLVAIEHPQTKEVRAYVDTDKAEAWLIENGLVVNATSKPGKGISPKATIEELTRRRQAKITQAEADAIDSALQAAIKDAPDKQVEALLSDTWLRAYHAITGNHRELDTTKAKRPALMRALLLDMLSETVGPNLWDDEDAQAIKQPAFEELARATHIDLEAIRAAAEAEATKDIDKQIATLQAQLNRQKAATPTTSLAQPKALPGKSKLNAPADAVAKAKPKKAKLTPEQAQLGIADAMQKGEEVAAKAAVLEVGQLVKVGDTNLRMSVARFAAKLGVITDVDGDDITVKLDGRNSFNAGTRVFESTELVPA